MGKLSPVEPVMLISGLIYSDTDTMMETLEKMEAKFGSVQLESEPFEFSHTNYYAKEMGPELSRKFVSFEKPVMPDKLAEAKLFTNRLESKYLNENGGRTINIDPGLIGLANLILASTKEYSHRIYLGKGIFGEVTLLYENRQFRPLGWTYPDYARDDVNEFMIRVRESLKEQIIQLRRGS